MSNEKLDRIIERRKLLVVAVIRYSPGKGMFRY